MARTGPAIDQALSSEQRSSFEQQIDGLKQQSQRNAQTLEITINNLQQELVQTTEHLTTVQNNASDSTRALQGQVDTFDQ
jgi:hypothetical protein